MAQSTSSNFLGVRNPMAHYIPLWVLVVFVFFVVVLSTMGGLQEGLAKRQFPDTKVNGSLEVTGTSQLEQIRGYRRPTKLLTDLAAATAHTALTQDESGTIILVPALTGGTQTITLPAVNANTVGVTFTFVMTATAGQDFNVGSTTADAQIVAVAPAGDGTNTAVSKAYTTIGFDATAVIGSAFTVTCVQTATGFRYLATNVIDGLAANKGGINLV